MAETHVPVTPGRSARLGRERDGTQVVLHYGSGPGELAACTRGVGLAARSDLALLRALAAPAGLDRVLVRLVGSPLAVGGAIQLGEAWWCRPDEGTLLVLCAHGSMPRLRQLLRDQALRETSLVVDHAPVADVLLGVVGRRAAELLRALGAYGPYGDARRAAPCHAAALGAAQVMWILESDTSAIACVPAAQSAGAVSVIAEQGRRLGLAWIGQEALTRYRLLQRRLQAGSSD